MTFAVRAIGRRHGSIVIPSWALMVSCVLLCGWGVLASAQQPDPAIPPVVPPVAPPSAAPAAPPEAAPAATPEAAPAAPPVAVPVPPPTTAPAAGAAPAKPKLPAAVEETLATRDGVPLVITYLAGTKGKDSVPVVLLHMHKGSRKDYKDLALYLQSLGHAVIVPDLRGHGASTKMTNGTTLTPNNVNFLAMASQDLETIKSFLVGKNNKEELNIEKLCVVGAEMGATVACAWAAIDWSWPVLATGKQGQDVKALVLLSPKQAFKNLKLTDALGRSQALQSKLAVLLCVGRDKADMLAETERIHGIFKRSHPEPANPEDKDLFLGRLPTTLQGTNLLTVENLGLKKIIEQFIEVRLVKQPWPWKLRATPQ